MQRDELVLSDVHVQINSSHCLNHFVSRFYFSEDGINTKRRKSDVEERDVTSRQFNAENEESNQSFKPVFSTENLDRHTENENKLVDGVDGDTGFEDLGLVNSDDKPKKLISRKFDVKDFNNDNLDGHQGGFNDVYGKVQHDEDGDCKIRRKKRKLENLSVVNIVHKKETCLENVGQQVWLASLLMSDYIISKREEFRGTKILELGAGVGLTSVMAAMYADYVICTDIGNDVLELAKYNLDNNIDDDTKIYRVAELDWFHNEYFTEEETQKGKVLSTGCSKCSSSSESAESQPRDNATTKSCDNATTKPCDSITTKPCDSITSKSFETIKVDSCDIIKADSCGVIKAEPCETIKAESCDNITAESCDIIISADVIYDDDATDALFRTVYGIMTGFRTHTWFIAIEKRFVFTWNDLDIACPAYQHFRENLTQLEDMDEGFTVSRVENFPQCFQYERTKELELWKVSRLQGDAGT